MSDNDDGSYAKRVASFVMAQERAEYVRSYVERGRRFDALSGDELRDRYAHGLRNWASDPADPDRLD